LAGDAAILHIAGALRACLRSADIAARFGGDEFAAVLHHADLASAQRVARRILERLRAHPLAWGSESLTITVGIGGAVGGGASTAIELLEHADKLLVHEAKPADRTSGCYKIEDA
jgi:diguanylate cyclase (GGDEF)-like protein